MQRLKSFSATAIVLLMAGSAYAEDDKIIIGGAMSLIDSAPLTVTGPLAAGTIRISAPNRLTLQGGQISSDDAAFAVAQGQGVAQLIQTGTTVVAPSCCASRRSSAYA